MMWQIIALGTIALTFSPGTYLIKVWEDEEVINKHTKRLPPRWLNVEKAPMGIVKFSPRFPDGEIYQCEFMVSGNLIRVLAGPINGASD